MLLSFAVQNIIRRYKEFYAQGSMYGQWKRVLVQVQQRRLGYQRYEAFPRHWVWGQERIYQEAR